MNKQDILNKLKDLNFDKDKYVVILDASLVLQGIIEETQDIDLACSASFYANINWDTKMEVEECKYNDVFKIRYNLYNEADYVIVEGYKSMSLESCLELKKLANNPKEKKLIKELDYLLGSKDNYRYERRLNKEGYKLIAGIDEVGRGPLVGPVVAAAVILPVNYKLEGLTDSKKLSEKKRDEYYDIIMRDAIAVGVGEISAKKIDEVNIYEASKLAMLEAIKKGHEEIKKIVAFQDEIQKACGKEKREVKLFAVPEELEKAIREYSTDKLDQAVRNPDKLARDEDIANVKAEAMEHFLELYPDAVKENIKKKFQDHKLCN